MQNLETTRRTIYQLLGAIPIIKEATRKKWADKLALPVFTIAMVFLFIGTIFYLISGYRSAFPNGIFPHKEKISYAPKTLTYERLIKNEKQKNGLYRNLFKLTITHPAGNTDPHTFTNLSLGQDGECDLGSKNTIAEIGYGIATTTQDYLMDCTTREPLLDNGNLFGIINNNEQSKKNLQYTK